MRKLLLLTVTLMFGVGLVAASPLYSATVGSRFQAENMVDLGNPDWAITVQDDGTADDGTNMQFKEIADSADKVRLNVNSSTQVDQIRIRARLSGAGAADDRLAVWVDGTTAANKVGTVLPPKAMCSDIEPSSYRWLDATLPDAVTSPVYPRGRPLDKWVNCNDYRYKGPDYATLTLDLASPISANANHQIYFGPNQANDAFIALDWAELHSTGVTPPPPDADGDGVPDPADACDNEPGPASNNGCPLQPADADGDGVPDTEDACGTESGPASNNGCPIEESPPPPADTDGDGVPDSEDNCDAQAGSASNGGCPLPQSNDYDRDGIPNAEDPISGLEEHQNIAGSPRIKSHCEAYATIRVDPIAFSQHLHQQIGNTTTTNESTGDSLFAAGPGATSCDMPWLTSAGWFPMEENEAVSGVNIYYRAPGDQRWVQELPRGFQLLSQDQSYRCSTAPEGEFQSTPPYGCNRKFGTRVDFPDCLDLRIPNDEANNAVESNSGRCPASHPYRIPKVNFLIMHPNSDGRITNPLRVSAGVDAWEDWTFMHGDYFAATQPQFNDRLVPLCLRNSRESVAHPDCGERN